MCRIYPRVPFTRLLVYSRLLSPLDASILRLGFFEACKTNLIQLICALDVFGVMAPWPHGGVINHDLLAVYLPSALMGQSCGGLSFGSVAAAQRSIPSTSTSNQSIAPAEKTGRQPLLLRL